MIKITIEKVTKEYYTEKKNLCTKETPTEIKKTVSSSYSSDREEVQFEREYMVHDISMSREVKTKLLEQEIADDTAFDLGAVIKAINTL